MSTKKSTKKLLELVSLATAQDTSLIYKNQFLNTINETLETEIEKYHLQWCQIY
jgi:hypothetical protein